jgi:hypothetical protein
MRFLHFMALPLRRSRSVGLKVVCLFAGVLAVTGGAYLVVSGLDTPASTDYTRALFAGSLVATLMAGLMLGTSRHFRSLEKREERSRLEQAAVALVFDAEGALILHRQEPGGGESWPGYWIPPGGLVDTDTRLDTAAGLEAEARDRLKKLVHDHPWGEARLVALTNGSRKYLRINRQEAQVPVQVYAYWFRWSGDRPLMPSGHPLKDDLRLVRPEELPEPVPLYYVELIDYLARLRAGESRLQRPECWTLPDPAGFRAALIASGEEHPGRSFTDRLRDLRPGGRP